MARLPVPLVEGKKVRVLSLAVTGTVSSIKDGEAENTLLQWSGVADRNNDTASVQHWAVVVRNMFKEEQIGNPGLLEVTVE